MSPPARVFRRAVTFCVLPPDLAHLHRPIAERHADNPDFEVVVERRKADRRQTSVPPPGSEERRVRDRRASSLLTTAADLDISLPRAARKHADRIVCVRRGVPLYDDESVQELDGIWARASAGDRDAREELRLRAFNLVHQRVIRTTPRKRSIEVTDKVFEALLGDGAPTDTSFDAALDRALSMVAGSR